VKRAFRILALVLAASVVLGLIFHNAVLGAMGAYLVNAGPPEKADIALVLEISLNTVATHVRNILAKTGCANRTEAAAYAMRHGLHSAG